MALFPKIQGPCPYKGALSEIMDGDICRLCKREVVDLDPLSDAERVALLAACKTEICVSYKIPLAPAIAAAMTAVVAVGGSMAAAQEAELDEQVIMVGSIRAPDKVEYVEVATDTTYAELPVVYDEPQAQDRGNTPKDERAQQDPDASAQTQR